MNEDIENTRLKTSAVLVQSSPMDTTGIQERVAQINAFYAARRAEREPQPATVKANTAQHVCARCGWTWRTFADAVPKSCPNCRARKWRVPIAPRISDTVRKCLHCGHEWGARKAARPCACPVCHARNWDRPPKFRRNAENVQNVPI